MAELITTVEPVLLKRLVELEQEAFGSGGMNEWHLVPLMRHGRVFVSKKNDSVVGAVQYMRDWNRPELAYMVGVSVAPAARGQGIGTELLAESIQQLFADNFAEVELTVAADNAAAVKVYKEKLGFEVTGFRENEYGQGQDRLVMVLTRERFIR
ncbi:GNAT family N-acetyltransferase [Sporomusa sphaeroides]|uniref:Acetyltransferase n=2 Tax=Sporomusa TaxID=2375 RepID=A0ABM9VZD1_9FIRM|nr:GNAT family N-acetyltransferase [Sporomusa sphaeroides]OLS57067.1 mycothiol acetyltransferase [Sporomusa sphaeroides DSM 2875]CVK18253.1 putative acetyltransferase [Sporomusa sphaeroides DSM 2875]SCM81643.1 GCN5-related N-acetyltransferase [uncultured Sporomusa sp.]